VTDLGKTLVFIGILIAIAGVVLMLLGKTNLPLGRLPGDILYRGKHTTFYFPLATSILVSVVLSLVLYFLGRIRR
jgi:Protein of unknown function (DUF2905)